MNLTSIEKQRILGLLGQHESHDEAVNGWIPSLQSIRWTSEEENKVNSLFKHECEFIFCLFSSHNFIDFHNVVQFKTVKIALSDTVWVKKFYALHFMGIFPWKKRICGQSRF